MSDEARPPAGIARAVTEPVAAERRQTILLVDDEVDILDSLKALLEAALGDVRVVTAASGAAGLETLRRESVDLIVTDYKMPGMSGIAFLERARDLAPAVPRILITAFPDLQVAIRAINEAGIESFFTKPFDTAKVVDAVRAVLAERRADEQRNRSFARSLDVLRRRLDP